MAHTLVNTQVHVSSELVKEQRCNHLRALENRCKQKCRVLWVIALHINAVKQEKNLLN
jgi:hypothetical protein